MIKPIITINNMFTIFTGVTTVTVNDTMRRARVWYRCIGTMHGHYHSQLLWLPWLL